jgi:exodeoxyribonuclease VIII
MFGTILHVMIDMETFGTKPNAAVATFGAVKFDPKANTVDISTSREWTLNVPHQMKMGRMMDPGTVAWWMTQSEEARSVVLPALNGKGIETKEFLLMFNDWLVEHGWTSKNPIKIWSHGATFDIVISTSMYDSVELNPPWRYVNARDTRTIFDMFKPKPVSYGVAHKAVDDAIKQAYMVNECYQLLLGNASKPDINPVANEATPTLPPLMTRAAFEQYVG